MPNRYQREIEEILRNLDQTEPKSSLSDRFRAFNQRPKPQRPRRQFRVTLTRTEVLFLIGIGLALIASGIAFYFQDPQRIPGYVSGGIALAAFLFILFGLVYEWSDRFRGAPPKAWRGNVVEMTPRRRPFSGLLTRFRILRLKMRYRRQRGREEGEP